MKRKLEVTDSDLAKSGKRKRLSSNSNEEKRKRTKPDTKENKRKKTKLDNEIPVSKREQTSIDSLGPITKSKWRNKTRVLVFSSRGVSFLQKQLMKDLRSLMPHSKPDTKMEKGVGYYVINEMSEIKNCNKCIYFESRKKSDLYMWMSNISTGPSVKFMVDQIHTMSELKLTGNCLKGSRPLLSFDKNFDGAPHLLLLKELFTQVFGVPNYHPKSKPFVDHVMTFSAVDDRIWIRNYQIVDENGELAEIGPQLTLNPIKILKGSFSGETLYDNPKYITPCAVRSMVRKSKGVKYMNRIADKSERESRKPDYSVFEDEVNKIFEDN